MQLRAAAGDVGAEPANGPQKSNGQSAGPLECHGGASRPRRGCGCGRGRAPGRTGSGFSPRRHDSTSGRATAVVGPSWRTTVLTLADLPFQAVPAANPLNSPAPRADISSGEVLRGAAQPAPAAASRAGPGDRRTSGDGKSLADCSCRGNGQHEHDAPGLSADGRPRPVAGGPGGLPDPDPGDAADAAVAALPGAPAAVHSAVAGLPAAREEATQDVDRRRCRRTRRSPPLPAPVPGGP